MSEESDNTRREFQDAAQKFEQAVKELAVTATSEVSERATTFLDEAAERLRGELDERRTGQHRADELDAPDEGERRPPQGARLRHRPRSVYYRDYERLARRSRKLYRDPKNEKIAGVCSGIANYFGVEAWVVRCMALTGLIFMPGIAFPAYWVAYFMMDRPPTTNGKGRRGGRRRRGRRRRSRQQASDIGDTDDIEVVDHSSPAPELGLRLSPRRSLRAVQADLAEIELRLRRMETHVTSGQYELQRELQKIETT